MSSILFAPTKTAVKNLKNEHVTAKIVNSGDKSVELVSPAHSESDIPIVNIVPLVTVDPNLGSISKIGIADLYMADMLKI